MVFQFYVLMLGLFLLVTKTFTSLILPKVCSQSTDALDTVFESTGLIEPGECIFELTLKPKTCGVRIGFDKFLFNQPVKKDSTSAYVCAADLDLLELSGLGLPNIDLSVLCGDLSGHHIYLPTKDYDELLPLIDVKKLILKVIHVLVPDAPTPLWKIRLTQLPCPGEIEQDKKSIFSLPPMGCLQFHEKPEGIIESLNFANGKGHYMAEMNYAICIKRQPDTCGIKFQALDFQLASNANSSDYTERDCDSLGLGVDVLGVSKLLNKDYVIIPDGVRINNGLKTYASKFCGSSLMKQEVIVVTKCPLYIGVVTDKLNDVNQKEVGFKIKYQLLNDCTLLDL